MAFASIIGSAIGILLLIITAYVLVGGILTTTQIAMNAQSEMTAIHIQMLGTEITPVSTTVGNCTVDTPPPKIIMKMNNSGSEPIDLSHIDVFVVKNTGTSPVPIKRASALSCTEWTWSVYPDTKVQWRPTEVLTMNVTYAVTPPATIQITTANGRSFYPPLPE